MSILAVISILMLYTDMDGSIKIRTEPWSIIDDSILAVFAVDYFVRLALAKDKVKFFRDNIFDLLAIIPFDIVFSIFRVSRVFRLLRVLRVFRLAGVIGKFQRNMRVFLDTTGLSWLILASLSIIFVSSSLYSVAEGVDWTDSMWWAMITVTTIGYGDISPHTTVGRFAAILLMLLGIGVIGMLTSSLTNFFAHRGVEKEEEKLDRILTKMDRIEQENVALRHKIDKLSQQDNNK